MEAEAAFLYTACGVCAFAARRPWVSNCCHACVGPGRLSLWASVVLVGLLRSLRCLVVGCGVFSAPARVFVVLGARVPTLASSRGTGELLPRQGDCGRVAPLPTASLGRKVACYVRTEGCV